MQEIRLLAVAGSQRVGSFNQRLLDRAASLAREAGVEVTQIRLSDFPLPLYTPQAEASGFPEVASELKALFARHDGFLIASPEYNGSVSAALKNALDWVSRPTGAEEGTAFSAFRGKVAGIMSASPGPFGGIRGLQHLRQILGTLHTLVVTEQVVVPFADKAFDGDVLLDGPPAQFLPVLVRRVIQLAPISA
ncbi:NAD(P)H-dependent oxidoreductase [Cupriavidus sp. AcVe19-1a]|uniref:NADPH-dependent FMN reductase n=1 Tax=Cupriavidus sp. AcVe19-1a TaxID=2821359 RepID=UPI001AE69A29|nr:NAD(P)H-dependent oxidoreductase [Cupriavidus sp. AcVe19-1a]MBP0630527.1 NAD(P)H-dependent oxidoreductase [Cupriavidus sp. AcVe19-1a]